MIGRSDIEAAARRLEGVVRPTPVVESHALSLAAGRRVLTKPEHLQRTGSFKVRGAYNRIRAAADEESADSVVAASAGNHAQGVALAASLTGLRSTIFMPRDAALPKVEATRGYGAEVVVGGDTVEDCMEEAAAYAARVGACLVHPFDDPLVIAGQGTIGLELVDEASEAETVVVPVGGGGLISGIAAALKEAAPGRRVVGVEPARAASMRAALDAGEPVTLAQVATIADGVAVRRVAPITLAHVRAYVDELVTVEEDEISQAVLLLLERSKWLVEPAGAVALAAVLAGRIPGSGPVAVVLSGGNVDPLLLTRLIEHGLTAAGRYLRLRVVLPDRPGALAALTAAVAELGLNLISVDHHRFGAPVSADETEVLLTVETRDVEHRDQVAPFLAARGFRAERTA